VGGNRSQQRSGIAVDLGQSWRDSTSSTLLPGQDLYTVLWNSTP